MDNQLEVKGIKEIEGMLFHDIEGGFGEGKKSMLVKEIAQIHERDLKDINRNINNNIKRFKNGIDILDLKVGESKSLSLELGYSNQSYANANNIYVLSERGYAKLLKILEDDFAWEQYEKLVDGYFNMRSEIKEKSYKDRTLDLVSKAIDELPNDNTKNKLLLKMLDTIDSVPIDKIPKVVQSDECIKVKQILIDFIKDEDVILKRTSNGIAVKREPFYELFARYGYTKAKILKALDDFGFIYRTKSPRRTVAVKVDGKNVVTVVLKNLDN